MDVEAGDPPEIHGSLGECVGVREIFVALKMDGNRLRAEGVALADADDLPEAANPHAVSEGDFGRHPQGQFDFVAGGQEHVGVEGDAAGA
jgi:hypothetical protein